MEGRIPEQLMLVTQRSEQLNLTDILDNLHMEVVQYGEGR